MVRIRYAHRKFNGNIYMLHNSANTAALRDARKVNAQKRYKSVRVFKPGIATEPKYLIYVRGKR